MHITVKPKSSSINFGTFPQLWSRQSSFCFHEPSALNITKHKMFCTGNIIWVLQNTRTLLVQSQRFTTIYEQRLQFKKKYFLNRLIRTHFNAVFVITRIYFQANKIKKAFNKYWNLMHLTHHLARNAKRDQKILNKMMHVPHKSMIILIEFYTSSVFANSIPQPILLLSSCNLHENINLMKKIIHFKQNSVLTPYCV